MGMELNAKATEYEYDKLNRLMKVTYEDGSYVEYTYDKNGNITDIRTEGMENVLPTPDTPDVSDNEAPDVGEDVSGNEAPDAGGDVSDNEHQAPSMDVSDNETAPTDKDESDNEDNISNNEDSNTDNSGTENTKAGYEFATAEGIVIRMSFPDGNRYTGRKICPQIEVFAKDGENRTALENKKDYTVTYQNNIKANAKKVTYQEKITYDRSLPAVIVKGKGNYAGTYRINFNIEPMSITDRNVDVTYTDVYALSKTKAVTPKVSVKYANKTLKKGRDYTLSVRKAGETEETIKIPKGAEGHYEILLKGCENSNFTGEICLPVRVVSGDFRFMNQAKVTVAKQYYSGKQPELEAEDMKVTIGGKKLILGADYIIKGYENAAEAGIAMVVLQGVEEAGCIGTIKKTFRIVGADIANATTDMDKTITYETGKNIADIENKIYYRIKDAVLLPYFNEREYLKKDTTQYETLKKGDTVVLTQKDYKVEYEDFENAGKAVVVLTGKGIFEGTEKKISYRIDKAELNPRDYEIEVSAEAEYKAGGAVPEVMVTEKATGRILVEGTDYKPVIKNNKKAGNTATISIKGMGNYKGTIKNAGQFAITAKSLQSEDIRVVAQPVKYTKDKQYKTNVTVYDGDKKMGKSQYIVSWPEEKIIMGGETCQKVTAKIEAKGTNYTGMREFSVHVYTVDMKKTAVTFAVDEYVYTGAEIMPKPEVTYNGSLLAEGVDYELEYSKNIRPGKATVKVKGLGTFGGIKTGTFRIVTKKIAEE